MSIKLKTSYLLASGAVLGATGVCAMKSLDMFDVTSDIAQIIHAVAAAMGISSGVLVALGLVPVALKYAKKIYEYYKTKVSQNARVQTNQNSNNHANAHGHLKALEEGYTSGALHQPVKPRYTRTTDRIPQRNSRTIVTR